MGTSHSALGLMDFIIPKSDPKICWKLYVDSLIRLNSEHFPIDRDPCLFVPKQAHMERKGTQTHAAL